MPNQTNGAPLQVGAADIQVRNPQQNTSDLQNDANVILQVDTQHDFMHATPFQVYCYMMSYISSNGADGWGEEAAINDIEMLILSDGYYLENDDDNKVFGLWDPVLYHTICTSLSDSPSAEELKALFVEQIATRNIEFDDQAAYNLEVLSKINGSLKVAGTGGRAFLADTVSFTLDKILGGGAEAIALSKDYHQKGHINNASHWGVAPLQPYSYVNIGNEPHMKIQITGVGSNGNSYFIYVPQAYLTGDLTVTDYLESLGLTVLDDVTTLGTSQEQPFLTVNVSGKIKHQFKDGMIQKAAIANKPDAQITIDTAWPDHCIQGTRGARIPIELELFYRVLSNGDVDVLNEVEFEILKNFMNERDFDDLCQKIANPVKMAEFYKGFDNRVETYAASEAITADGQALTPDQLFADAKAFDVTGIARDFCCYHAAKELRNRDVGVNFYSDLTRAVFTENTNKKQHELGELGVNVYNYYDAISQFGNYAVKQFTIQAGDYLDELVDHFLTLYIDTDAKDKVSGNAKRFIKNLGNDKHAKLKSIFEGALDDFSLFLDISVDVDNKNIWDLYNDIHDGFVNEFGDYFASIMAEVLNHPEVKAHGSTVIQPTSYGYKSPVHHDKLKGLDKVVAKHFAPLATRLHGELNNIVSDYNYHNEYDQKEGIVEIKPVIAINFSKDTCREFAEKICKKSVNVTPLKRIDELATKLFELLNALPMDRTDLVFIEANISRYFESWRVAQTMNVHDDDFNVDTDLIEYLQFNELIDDHIEPFIVNHLGLDKMMATHLANQIGGAVASNKGVSVSRDIFNVLQDLIHNILSPDSCDIPQLERSVDLEALANLPNFIAQNKHNTALLERFFNKITSLQEDDYKPGFVDHLLGEGELLMPLIAYLDAQEYIEMFEGYFGFEQEVEQAYAPSQTSHDSSTDMALTLSVVTDNDGLDPTFINAASSVAENVSTESINRI